MLQTRLAKEQLLAANAPEAFSVTLLGGGSRLIGGARRAELTRQRVYDLALDGFLPRVSRDERPAIQRNAMTTLGLPYASDPAITRHLAHFLGRHGCTQANDYPDTLLLNGGAFNSPLLRERLIEVIESWREGPVDSLLNPRPDLSVAMGAVVYGRSRSGQFLRIGGFSTLLLPAIGTGERRHRSRDARALPAPQGAEEEKDYFLTGRRFALRVGQPVKFHLVSSTDETQLQKW